MCALDWQQVLEFLKAVAAPAATLGAVVLVARYAISTFRAQKLIERRLDWHEKVHRSLHSTSDAYARAAYATRINDPQAGKRWQAAGTQSERLAELCAESWLYARQAGFAAVEDFQQKMRDGHVEFAGKGDALAERVMRICMSTASRLSADMRRDMGIEDLKVNIYRDPGSGELKISAD